MLYCKKKYHWDASAIAEYLAAAIVKQYPTEIIHIFDAYSQDAARDAVWKNRVLRSAEEDELEKYLQKQLDWIRIEEEESKSFKRSLEEVHELSMGAFATQSFGSANKKSCSESSKESVTDQHSDRESLNSSAPE